MTTWKRTDFADSSESGMQSWSLCYPTMYCYMSEYCFTVIKGNFISYLVWNFSDCIWLF